MKELEASLNRFFHHLCIMEGLIEETESVILKSLHDFDRKGPRICSFDHDFGSDEYYSFRGHTSYDFEEVMISYKTLMPGRMRASTFLTIFGMFECEMDALTVAVLKFKDQIWGLKDFKQQGLERCNHILKKLLSIKHSATRDKVMQISKLRNICTHSNRCVENKDEHFLKALGGDECFDLIESGENYEIAFKDKALEYILSCFNVYYYDIVNAIKAPGNNSR
ncbi:hypothetical protein GWD52_11715 [Enterobacteriaceae bacterium 4M9]|nr:hypothetical protein [Enterobacteriaceae bacterium 4M9]